MVLKCCCKGHASDLRFGSEVDELLSSCPCPPPALSLATATAAPAQLPEVPASSGSRDTDLPPEEFKFNNSCWACALKEEFVVEPPLVLKALALADRAASRLWHRATRGSVTAAGIAAACVLLTALTPTGVLVSVAEASWLGAAPPASASATVLDSALVAARDTRRVLSAAAAFFAIFAAALFLNAMSCEDNAVKSQHRDVEAEFAVRNGEVGRRVGLS